MNKSFVCYIFLTITAFQCLTAGKTTKSWDCLPMSMYVEQGCLKDSSFIDKISFDNFDNIYLMDISHWNSEAEFDNSIDGILATEGRQFKFTKDDLFRYVVESAHKENTKVSVTFINDLVYGSLDPQRRAKLVKALMHIVDNYDFDGIDIDWESHLYPNIDKHALLLHDLRNGLDSLSRITRKDYNLSTALSVEAQYPDSLKPMLAEAVDWINLMAYDLGGCLWRNYASHNTPMKLIADCVENNWIGIPREKLHLGLASYGFVYTDILPDEVLPDPDRLHNHGRYAIYTELIPYIYGDHPWIVEYDDVEKSYYYINPAKKEFITVETPETIKYKFDYAVEAGLGGTFWWEYCKDIVADNNGGDKWLHILVPKHKKVNKKKHRH